MFCTNLGFQHPSLSRIMNVSVMIASPMTDKTLLKEMYSFLTLLVMRITFQSNKYRCNVTSVGGVGKMKLWLCTYMG